MSISYTLDKRCTEILNIVMLHNRLFKSSRPCG